MTANLVIGAREWLLPAGLAVALALLLLIRGYWVRSGAGAAGVAAFLLKACGLAALAACLIEPLWTTERFRPGANLFVVLADNSESMTIRDRDRTDTRGQRVQALLANDQAPWRVRLGQDFDVRQYVFDARLTRTADFSELTFNGRATALQQVLRTLQERFAERPLAGVLLLTDGSATDTADVESLRHGLPPVFPIAFDDTTGPADDVGITTVAVSQTAFENAPVSLRADVAVSGFDGQTIVAQVLDTAGLVVQRKLQPVSADGRPLTFRFQLRPTQSGPTFYRVRATAVADAASTADTTASEATPANNERLVVVDRGTGPYPVLYVSGRPNWEFKFLNRALAEDDQVHLIGLMRIATREPKFDWRGRAGENTNPLFRGFRDHDEEQAERYDEPVLVRMNVRDPGELRDGFPKTAAELFAYHAVILDDVESAFFTHDQMKLLERFVSERGGGLLMLGGMNAFRHGKYQRTPIADLLPVYLEAPRDAPAPRAPLRWTLAREGWLQPWLRLRDNEDDERARIGDMPAFTIVSQASGIKPGASVLAAVTDAASNTFPALITQPFGRGRCAALMIGDLWRWRMRAALDNEDPATAMRQIVRWLIADVPGRVDVDVVEQPDDPGAPIRMRVQVRNADFQPLDNAGVKISVEPPGADPLLLDAEPSLEQPGLYEAAYVPRDPGAYRANVDVTDPAGAAVGQTETGWTANPAADEFRDLHINHQRLASLAEATGGQVVAESDLESFVRGLPNRKMPVTQRAVFPLWHRPFVFLLALACLVGEWGLRRWKGMP